MARVTSSERSWLSFWSSTTQKVTMRVANHRANASGPARSVSAEATGSTAGSTGTAELTSLVGERVARVVAEDCVERGRGAERGLEGSGSVDRTDTATVHQCDAITRRVCFVHVMRRDEHGHVAGCA